MIGSGVGVYPKLTPIRANPRICASLTKKKYSLSFYLPLPLVIKLEDVNLQLPKAKMWSPRMKARQQKTEPKDAETYTMLYINSSSIKLGKVFKE